MFKTISAVYVLFWLYKTTLCVGKEYIGGIYSHTLPFTMVAFIITSMLLGYMIAKEDGVK